MRKGILYSVGSALLSVLLGGSLAIADPTPATTSVDSLTTTVTTASVSVAGKATFAAAPVQVVDDSAGDPSVKGIGADITTGTIGSEPTTPKLVFTLHIGDAPPAADGVPVVVFYNWSIAVTHPDGTSDEYGLQASRAYGSGLPSANAGFNLFTCATDPTTGQGSCSSTYKPVGSFAGGTITWPVPLIKIGAAAGDVVAQGADGVFTTLGGGAPVVGDVWFTSPTLDSASVDVEYPVLTGTVQLGIGSAGTDPATVPLTANATKVNKDGTFTATLPLPATAGAYEVVAKACYGADVCGLRTADFTV
jgi:hypothetical protein